MTDILRNLLKNHPVIYVATNGRRRWGICRPFHTKGFFLYECGVNWYIIRKERLKTIQEAMDSAQLAENISLVWNEVQPQM